MREVPHIAFDEETLTCWSKTDYECNRLILYARLCMPVMRILASRYVLISARSSQSQIHRDVSSTNNNLLLRVYKSNDGFEDIRD
jgi:hypothetical protein